jgi:hypothetical protein
MIIHTRFVKRRGQLSIWIILLLLMPPIGGLLDMRGGTPTTFSDPGYDSILAACKRGDIPLNQPNQEWNGSWQISTSEGCAPRLPGALVLTLDDQSHLATWWKQRPMFIENELKFTMFIDRAYHLNETEWGWLETFQEDGHEIAIHSKNHANVTEFLDAGRTMDEYIVEQIDPELKLFREHGFNPTAFSYPDGHRTPESDEALLEIFDIVRGTNRWHGSRMLDDTPALFDERVVKGHSTDRKYNPINEIKELMKDASENGRAVITYGHRLTALENPYHTTEPSDLIQLAEYAKELGMPLLTISDLSTPANKEGTASVYRSVRVSNLTIGERILENCWNLPRFEEVCFDGELPKWNEDPFQENYWRFVFYSMRPLMHLLHAWEITGEERYREHLIDLIESYQNASLDSPWIYNHQADKHGAAFRALVLTEIRWSLAHGGALSHKEQTILDGLVLSTADYLMIPSNFEHTYNHGFNQAAGLLAISTNFPHLQGSLLWDQTARERLNYMMQHTVDENGVMMESTPYYHHYVLLLMGDVTIWADKHGISLPHILKERFPKMIEYITDMAQPDGSLPLIGSGIPSSGLSSGGYSLWENSYPRLAYVRSGGLDGNPEVENRSHAYLANYPISGHIALRSSWDENPDDISHVMVDAGPFRTSHSQLDHFTITWFKENPILVDPGLFSYEKGVERDYFEGTRAHNVVVIDGKDQTKSYSILSTDTYSSESSVGVVSSIEIQGNVWTRAIILIDNETLVIMDDVKGGTSRSHVQTWHFDDNLDIITSNNEREMKINSEQQTIGTIQWKSVGEIKSEIIEGKEDPLQGWIVNAYESRIPAPVIELTQESNHLQIATVFQLGQSEEWKFEPQENLISFEIGMTNFILEERGNGWIWTNN